MNLSNLTIDDLIAVVMKAMAFDLLQSKLLVPKGIIDKVIGEVQDSITSGKNPKQQKEIALLAAALAEKLQK